MTYISLISWVITKFGLALDMADFSNDMREKMSDFRMKINNNELSQKIIDKQDHIIDQENKLVLRQYSTDIQMSDKAVLFFHGGGYAISNIDVYNPVASLMCEELNSNIFSLEYSLSPENKFPKALEEANIAFEWLRSYGYSKEQIIICGDSAGAHLAASLLHDLKIRDKELPFLQVLIYPMVSPSLDFPSMERLGENFLLTKEHMKWFWHYLRAKEINNLDSRFDLLKIDNNNKLHKGIDAFIVIWKNLKYWNFLAKLAALPIIKQILDLLYISFANWRFNRLTHCIIAKENDNKL